MSNDLNDKLIHHDHRLSIVEQNTASVLGKLDKLTEAMYEQATQFGIFASKHDTIGEEVKTVKEEVAQLNRKLQKHSEDIASIKPVTDAVRGLAWKIITGSILGGSGVAAIIAAFMKAT